ncbi:MAG: CCA tRNA nucleotidyltransferase [Marinosulfonomonas sp.]
MTRIDDPWVHHEPTQKVLRMLTDAGHQAYFVGGCVRNALMGLPANDIDIATDAAPEKVMALAEAAGLHAVGTGVEHGTVTVISNHMPHEVTTFRRDVETDGRRAVVAFSKDIDDDARRRDFTMNALYADSRGRVVDPLSGLGDLRTRRIRFVDDATLRIKEDYLRTLRFFRFHAWYGDPDTGMDAEALAAIAENLDGLEGLSKERVGAEVKKLLAAPDPAPSVGAMAQTGVLSRILPGADMTYLAPLVHIENGQMPDVMRRLAVLGGDDPALRFRLSRDEKKQLQILSLEIGNPTTAQELAYRHGADMARDIEMLRAAVFERALPDSLAKDLDLGATAVFPVTAADLMPDLQGPALGARLKELEKTWINSGFSLGRDQLLNA